MNSPPALVTDERADVRRAAAEVRQAAAAMIDLGVRPGDRVAIWSPNTWHWVVACLATHYAGAVVVPLNTRYTASEATDILARTEAPLLIAIGEFLGTDRGRGDLDRDALPALRHIVRVPMGDDGDGHVGRVRRRGTNLAAVDARAAAVSPDDVSDILFTSGTTGRSKGVLCAHRQSLGAGGVGGVRPAHQRRPLSVHQPVLPQLRLQGGHPGLPADRRDADPAADVRPRTGDARGAGAPHHGAARAADHLPDAARPSRARRLRPDSLRFAVTGAATVPVVLIERMQSELDIDIVLTAYGLTEASGFGTMCRADDDAVTVATTCGRPIADFELAIDGAARARCCCADPTSCSAISTTRRRPPPRSTPTAGCTPATSESSTSAAICDITDRLKDMYICGGFNVYPAEIEQVLARLDGVADAAVIGVPDERLGEVGKAFVVAPAGCRAR